MKRNALKKKSTAQSASVRPGSTLRLEVTGIAPGGIGVAQEGNLRYYVRGGLPGDLVDARVVKRERGWIEAVVTRRLRSRMDRIVPPCRHFPICGGCLWQDLAYQDQLILKKGIVQHCFREAGIDGGLVADVIGADEAFFYRNKMDFSFGLNEAGELTLGLYVSPWKAGAEKASSVRVYPEEDTERDGRLPPVFDVEECWLQSPLSNRILNAVRSFLKGCPVRPYDPERRTGLLRSLVIREGKNTGEVLVNLVTASMDMDLGRQLGNALTTAVEGLKGVALSVNPRRSKNAPPQSERVLTGEGQIAERMDGLEFAVSPTSFFQVNTRQAERLYRLAIQFCALTGQEKVLDLYCGTGALSLLLAQRTGAVTGVEAVRQAVDDAQRNAERNRIGNCRFVCGDVLRVLPDLMRAGEGFDVVTVNPPRAGIYKAVISAICALRPRRVVYISCNPETLARDIPHFWVGGYRLQQVQPVDLFPHTPHCEVVAAMTLDIGLPRD